MPVLIDIEQRDHHLFARSSGNDARHVGRDRRLEIGIVNNMPDAALMSTERQVLDLLEAASEDRIVRLHFYTIPATPRSQWGRDYVGRYYRTDADLLNGLPLDGIIVTGAEPVAATLTQEPYWDSFVRIVDWARENTASAAYSCLAVHGAVLHMDGVERHALREKCIGVFAQTKVADHPLTRNLPRFFRTPHARWNEVREEALADCGYNVLTKSAEAGVDCFVKKMKDSLFVHFHGHPEYDAQSLLGEFRRDMGRFLRGESEVCPTVPKGYFKTELEEMLADFRRKAICNRGPAHFADFPTDRLAKEVTNDWHPAAGRIYGNWLTYMADRRTARPASSPSRGPVGELAELDRRRGQRQRRADQSPMRLP